MFVYNFWILCSDINFNLKQSQAFCKILKIINGRCMPINYYKNIKKIRSLFHILIISDFGNSKENQNLWQYKYKFVQCEKVPKLPMVSFDNNIITHSSSINKGICCFSPVWMLMKKFSIPTTTKKNTLGECLCPFQSPMSLSQKFKSYYIK